MKTLLLILMVFITGLSFGQTEGKIKTSVSGGTCTCQPGQSVCQASALFMSCCMCCEAGSSCGAWSAFGLCGCACEKVSSRGGEVSEVRFYLNKYNDFMNYLDKNEISSDKFRKYVEEVSLNRTLIKTENADSDYIELAGDELKDFTDRYLSDIRELAKDEKISAILDFYINQK